jgi:flagellar L-ring protein precursor FlgH
MKGGIAAIVVFTGLTTLPGCMLIPFAPTIAHVAPRLLFPGHDPNNRNSPDGADNANQAEAQPTPDSNANPAPADNAASKPAPENRAQLADGTIAVHMDHTDIASDSKAHDVGDVLMVNVAETINGESSAQTDLSNKRSNNAALPNMFSAAESLAKHNPMLNLSSLLNSSSDNETTGKGDMSANDTLNALVAVSVIGTQPGGKLKIKGSRSIRINGENDTLFLSGTVDPSDIDSNNSIPSSRVADLRLSFTGAGQIRDKQGNGLGTRMMDWLWLF